MRINSVMVSERVGEDWLVLDPDTSRVHQLSGLSAVVFSAVIAGTEIPVGCEHAIAALVTANILTVDNPPNHRSLLNGTTTAAAPGISRRRLISTGALAAGAATLAATVGIHTFILPTAASAASPSATPAAPTGVTATPSASQQITVNWTNVDGATSYKVFYRIFGSPVDTAYTEFPPVTDPPTTITTGPVTVTGLSNTTTYEFYVVAIAGAITSAASAPLATATATALPVVYAATGGGLSISNDGGTTFTNRTTTQGLGSNTVLGVLVSGSTVYAATDGGLSISTDGGATFTNRTTTQGLGDNYVSGVFVLGSTVYAATGNGLGISTNGGATFTNKNFANSSLGVNFSSFLFGVFAVESTTVGQPATVYAATDVGLSISTDGGTTFTNKTRANTANGLGSNTVYGVFASGSTVYAATTGGLSISTDGGTTFTNRTTTQGLGNNTVNKVFVSGSTVYAATNGGLSISTDGGATFTNRTTTQGLGSNTVLGVFVLGSTVYAATGNGLSISTDGGATFTNRTGAGLGNNFLYGVFAVPGAS